ncbi:MAG TPA: sigma 54-interacting transcriptional regulator [Bacteroidota bacterium]|nr:sigma 54-interacting transcriptional regulator [Bacteroidota bacterium]
MIKRGKYIIVGGGLALVCLVATVLFPGFVDTVDHSILFTQYRVRGPLKPDSSVVILYFNSDDISILGDLPLKRNYYALVVDVLQSLHAKAVGFDIGFTEREEEHRDYDNLFSSVVQRAGNVVLGGYFRTLGDEPAPASTDTIEKSLHSFSYSDATAANYYNGSDVELPFPELLAGASAVGHTNIDDRFNVPLFIRSGKALVPAFALELLRVGVGAKKSDVTITPNDVRIAHGANPITLPFDERGVARINYAGSIGVIPSYPVVSFLKAYDTLKSGGTPSIPVQSAAGKIVLVGIIAEGRSAFFPTPYQQQFPSVGLHAMFIENALQGYFLQECSLFGQCILVVLFAGLIVALFSGFRISVAIGGTVVLTVLALCASMFAFSHFVYIIPLARLLLTTIVVSFALVLYKHQEVQAEMELLRGERERIDRQLRDKERVLAMLEREMSSAEGDRGTEPSRSLVEEVQKFKEEIRQLKLKAEDLQPGSDAPNVSLLERKEYHGIIYRAGGPMEKIVEFARMIADNDAPLLILGESGTGKELIARSIHLESRRRDKPFIAVNCGALSETLLESELFGHERGAFTGAIKEKPGRFELANSGVIFLDEIAETSEAFQVKLLRVLQEGTFERVGGTETHKVNVRVLAATNRDVRKSVEEKKFREDLYYRLNVFTVNIPPLRERPEDLPLLIESFVRGDSPETSTSVGVINALVAHRWQGNVRELQSVLKRAVIMASSEGRNIVQLKDLPAEISRNAALSGEIEDRILLSLRQKQFSRSAISETADELGGLSRGTVAEYFRGTCFKSFYDKQWNFDEAVRMISGTDDTEMTSRVEKKFREYLSNAVENVNHSVSFQEIKRVSSGKYKNLPQRYHPFLDEIIESFYRKKWTLRDGEKAPQ